MLHWCASLVCFIRSDAARYQPDVTLNGGEAGVKDPTPARSHNAADRVAAGECGSDHSGSTDLPCRRKVPHRGFAAVQDDNATPR